SGWSGVRRAAGGDAAPLLARIAAARELPDAGAAALWRPAESPPALDATRRIAGGVGAAAGHRSRPAAGRLRRAAHDDLGALLPQGAVRHRLVGDGRHATHVIAVAGRARTVAGLIGGGATGRDGLLVARHRAAGRARTLVSAVVGAHADGRDGEQEEQREKRYDAEEPAPHGRDEHSTPPLR